MRAEDLLTEERRARMAAERMLALKEAELQAANRMLSRHAVNLSENLVETRVEMAEVKGENNRVRADLVKVSEEVAIAKRRLWNSIQTIHDGFAVFDAESRLIIANAAYLAPFDGLECVRPGAHYEEVLEAAISEGVVDIEGMTPAAYRDALLTRWRSPDPAARVIRLWDGTHVRLVDNRAPGGDTVSLGLNITDSVRREEVLKEARNRAEAANRAKSAFLANMSHEIRTPMNGVVGMADLLAESELDEEQHIFVDTIRSSGQALLSIINDVLDYSKIEAAKVTLRPAPFDLERTILEVIQLLSPSIREKGLKVMLDYDIFLPTLFTGDAVRLRQVLTNLMGNAVKFTQKGHVLVRVLGLPVDGGAAQQLHVTVEDTGIGIPNDMLGHVFGEFNQVEDERNRAYEGTGLGLAISHKLIRLMGGEIWVESDLGVGSAFGFHVTLPVAKEPEAPALPGWISRALLVMGDDLHRTILEKRLIALGLEVEAVGSAAAANDGRAQAADVIFADQHLPDMAAAAFIAVLRQGGARAPVLLMAAPGGSTEPMLPGAAGVLQKTSSRADLLDALAQLPEPLNQPSEKAQPDTADEADWAGDADTALELPAVAEAEPEAELPLDVNEPKARPVFGSVRRHAGFPEAETVKAPAAPDTEADAAQTARVETVEELTTTPEPQPLAEPDTEVAADAEAGPAPNALAAEASSPAAARPELRAAPEPADETETSIATAIAPESAAMAPPAATAAPVAAPVAAETGTPVPPATETEVPAPLRRMRVLAAEDNKTNQLVFSKLVKACDIDLTFAANGAEAVAAFESAPPDLVFMDISMPGMDGKEATRRIRAFEAQRGLARTRIVALTAHAMDGDAEEILAHGLDAHLTKPFKKPAILAEISAARPGDARPALPASDALPEALATVVEAAQKSLQTIG